MHPIPARAPLTAVVFAALAFLAAPPTLAARSAADRSPAAPAVDIPFEMKVLPNGLRVVVHEDRKAPVVAVNIWYHVGSKDEQPGRTGFAHLFEHLMFQGSENLPDEYLNFMQALGSTDLNGTTFFDRTNYFQTVPTPALDTVLFAESDRMGHFKGAITQEVLDEQRGVVKNEKRQGDNQPYGRVFQEVLRQLFPPDHPYSWETIGSMEDLDAATLEDVKAWFDSHYGPNNAVLVLAGDVSPAEGFAKAEKFFGHIPPGPPMTRLAEWIPSHDRLRRQQMEDRVSQPRLYLTWTGPRWGTRDAHLLDLASAILAGDKNSRLYQRLVYRDQLASDVAFATLALEIAGITYLQVSANPGVALATLEAAVNEELERFRREGPTAEELERVKAQRRADFLRGIEKVGGFVGKAGILAESTVYGGSPDAWKRSVADTEAATSKDLADVVARWVTTAPFVLEVTPVPRFQAGGPGVDRSAGPPLPASQPEVSFPGFERSTLSNGLKLIVVERPGVPLVNLRLVLDAGYAADDFGRPGTAALTMRMLDEGTRTRDTLEISRQLARLGATLGTAARLDTSSVGMTALLDKLEPSLEIFADVILNPVFPDKELDRLRRVALAALSQEKTQPNAMALRVMPRLLYGEGHPYAQPLTGSGTEADLLALTREDLQRFHSTWFRPNHATLIFVGPVSAATIRPTIERLFGRWQPGEIPVKEISTAAPGNPRVLYLLDRPGAEQSVIFAGQLLPPAAVEDNLAIEAMNDVLGGQFTARINMNLRETKHWSYGARSFIADARGPRALLTFAAVQQDRTADSLREIQREFAEIVAARPASPEEVALVQDSRTLSLPGRWETNGAVLDAVTRIEEFGLPDDYWAGFPAAMRRLNVADINAAARRHLKPAELIWVVVGDRAVIEPELAGLDFDAIRLLDADGNLL